MHEAYDGLRPVDAQAPEGHTRQEEQGDADADQGEAHDGDARPVDGFGPCRRRLAAFPGDGRVIHRGDGGVVVGRGKTVGGRPVVDGGEVVGSVLRTRDDVKPVFVSPGHRMDQEGARELVLESVTRYRLPEPIRKIVGDLSNTEKTLVGLQLRPRG